MAVFGDNGSRGNMPSGSGAPRRGEGSRRPAPSGRGAGARRQAPANLAGSRRLSDVRAGSLRPGGSSKKRARSSKSSYYLNHSSVGGSARNRSRAVGRARGRAKAGASLRRYLPVAVCVAVVVLALWGVGSLVRGVLGF